jgi:hypothetical protein
VKIIPPQNKGDIENISEKKENDLTLQDPYMKHGEDQLEKEKGEDKYKSREKNMLKSYSMKSSELSNSSIRKQEKKQNKTRMKSNMEKKE